MKIVIENRWTEERREEAGRKRANMEITFLRIYTFALGQSWSYQTVWLSFETWISSLLQRTWILKYTLSFIRSSFVTAVSPQQREKILAILNEEWSWLHSPEQTTWQTFTTIYRETRADAEERHMEKLHLLVSFGLTPGTGGHGQRHVEERCVATWKRHVGGW